MQPSFKSLLQHQGPLTHVSHAHRVGSKPTSNVAPTGVYRGGFSMDQDGRRNDGGRYLTMGMEPERTPEEQKLILERQLEMVNQEIEYILATGRAYEALNAEYDRIVAHNGHAMSDEIGEKWMYHREEIKRLTAGLDHARMMKAKVEAQLSRFYHGGPLPQPDAWRAA